MLLSLVLMLHLPIQDAATPDKVTRVHFRGELLRRDRDGFSPIDAFDVTCFHSRSAALGCVLLQDSVDRAIWTASVGKDTPRVRHTHDGVPYRLEFLPLTITRELSSGQVWTNGRRNYRVGSETRHKGRECVEVLVNEGPARNHKLLVEKQTGAVVLLEQRVFMGRGDEFRLTLDVRDEDPQNAAADAALFAQLLELRSRIGAGPDKPDTTLSADQLAMVAAALPKLRTAAVTPWARKLLAKVEADTSTQQNRTKKLADLKRSSVGQPLPDFLAATISGGTVDSKKLSGNIVVLHFWKYRDEPLSDPYGQTAYLDFLSGKNAGKPVKVIGFNVDTRYTDRTQARKADRSARKLVEFMNLSYDIAGDDGTLLKKLGDPRVAAATLPLWIVADRNGKIAIWKDGYYPVDPQSGLKDLQQAIDKLLP